VERGEHDLLHSDRDGAENIWTRREIIGPDKEVTLPDGRVLWPSITKDGKTIVFERDFGIWTADCGSGQAHVVPIERRGASSPSPEHAVDQSVQDLALSPDGKKSLSSARRRVAASAKDAGDATRAAWRATQSRPIWSPDSRRLVSSRARPRATALSL
jgi:hypothetical protein